MGLRGPTVRDVSSWCLRLLLLRLRRRRRPVVSWSSPGMVFVFFILVLALLVTGGDSSPGRRSRLEPAVTTSPNGAELAEEDPATTSLPPPPPPAAPGCSWACVRNKEIERDRIDSLKAYILEKLGLSEPPRIPPHLRRNKFALEVLLDRAAQAQQHPSSPARFSWAGGWPPGDQPTGAAGARAGNRDYDEDVVKPRKVVAFAETGRNDSRQCHFGDNEIHFFRFSKEVMNYEVAGARLWVFLRAPGGRYENYSAAKAPSFDAASGPQGPRGRTPPDYPRQGANHPPPGVGGDARRGSGESRYDDGAPDRGGTVGNYGMGGAKYGNSAYHGDGDAYHGGSDGYRGGGDAQRGSGESRYDDGAPDRGGTVGNYGMGDAKYGDRAYHGDGDSYHGGSDAYHGGGNDAQRGSGDFRRLGGVAERGGTGSYHSGGDAKYGDSAYHGYGDSYHGGSDAHHAGVDAQRGSGDFPRVSGVLGNDSTGGYRGGGGSYHGDGAYHGYGDAYQGGGGSVHHGGGGPVTLSVGWVKHLEGGDSNASFVASVKTDVPTGKGRWVHVDLTKTVASWFRGSDGDLGLVLSASDASGRPVRSFFGGEDGESRTPFIELTPSAAAGPSRARRALGIECNATSEEKRCCRYPLTVDFDYLEWDWVVAPKTYEANYCAGDCTYAFLPRYPHSYIVQVTNRTICCGPRKMSPISMVYFNKEHHIVFSTLPGMSVEKCGCS
ncbi:uncharacterized protein LOC134541253 [Bacillus rossius redtenbacheri]|uniref:uncharacterized protein LOC134541253 n=1 Tax=Bacillus rossius redtenbacheri TaxID=93214 RepID=UPI002FDDDC04